MFSQFCFWNYFNYPIGNCTGISDCCVLTAVLKKLLTVGCKVISTTHFLEIFFLGLLRGIKVLQMTVYVPDSEDGNAVPLFKLEDGVANSSVGLVCAKMAGVSKGVIGRSKEILGALKDGQPVLPIPPSLNSNSVFQPSACLWWRHQDLQFHRLAAACQDF